MRWMALGSMTLLTALLTGCASFDPVAGDACDVFELKQFAGMHVVEFLAQEDPALLRQIIADNEYLTNNCV